VLGGEGGIHAGGWYERAKARCCRAMAEGCPAKDISREEGGCRSAHQIHGSIDGISEFAQDKHQHVEHGAWRSILHGESGRDERVTWEGAPAHVRGGRNGTLRSRSVRLVVLGLAATVGVVCLGAVFHESSGSSISSFSLLRFVLLSHEAPA